MPTPEGNITSTETWAAPAVEEVVEEVVKVSTKKKVTNEEV